ncbi:MAG: ImmA/IrrE family metallo-endopeptidase [Deltaproteobacteria bacterium]|nr:ImmA/IrrE family metallo-endopeptidase [Deltaproteobacteria bacterium]
MQRRNNWADADVERGERLARKAYKELKLRHPLEASLEAIALLRGARVVNLPLDGALGRLVRKGKKAILTVSDRIPFPERRRFVIAHELGHHELHEKVMQLDVCDEAKIDEVYDQATEREANAFAAEFLMPAALWKKHVDVAQPTFEVIAARAREYQVSLTSAAIRFVKLSPERCAIAFVNDRQVAWSVSSDDLWQRVRRGRVVGSFTRAVDYWEKGRVPAEPEEVPASAWFDRPDADDVIEQVRPVPSLNSALVLLWFRSE